jgi:hypothetical protein
MWSIEGPHLHSPAIVTPFLPCFVRLLRTVLVTWHRVTEEDILRYR